MKQFTLREKKEFIKILKEPPLEKKKINWSRIMYLVIFFILLFLFIKRIYNGNINILADGQIELPRQTINFPQDIKVVQLFIEEGTDINKGDTLFVYKVIRDEMDKVNLSSRSVSDSWITKEILSIKKKIKLNQIIISNSTKNIDLINSQIDDKESLLLGGVHDEYDNYGSLQNQKTKILSDIDFLSEEIKLLKNHLIQLRKNEREYNSINYSKLAIYDQTEYFVAPIDGVISDVFYKENEICYKKEEMMTIHQLKDASIITYFDTNEIDHLSVGDEVEISFPDGNIQTGIISKFFVSTYALPSEFQKKYEPTERNIVAQVIPRNPHDETSWQKFYKMDVKIKKQRYSFL